MDDPLSELVSEIGRLNKLQVRFLGASLASLSSTDQEDLKAYIEFHLREGRDIAYLAQCYDLIVRDTLREQIYFSRHQRYRYSRFEETASAVYYNGEYMTGYMVGLALTAFLWENHRRIRHFFSETLQKDKEGSYLEIGPGHGFYFMEAMRNTRFTGFVGIDISPVSIKLTGDILGSGFFGRFSNYQLIEGDFLNWCPGKDFDAITLSEVLEHVENPACFLDKIAGMTKPCSTVFVNTCVNSPAIDHIYLYRSVSEIEGQVREAGFHPVRRLVVPHAGTTLEQSERHRFPINVAMVLEKRS